MSKVAQQRSSGDQKSPDGTNRKLICFHIRKTFLAVFYSSSGSCLWRPELDFQRPKFGLSIRFRRAMDGWIDNEAVVIYCSRDLWLDGAVMDRHQFPEVTA